MKALLGLSRAIDWMNQWLGQVAAWAIVVAVAISAGNAIMRRFFGISSNSWLELQWYLFGAVVMLCASWALREGAHVRIDVVASQFSRRWRNWLDLFGLAAFLLPFATLMVWLAWPYAVVSIRSGEISLNPGGLMIWPIKLVILLGFASLLAQGVSEIIKRVAIMTGRLPDVDEPAAEDSSLSQPL